VTIEPTIAQLTRHADGHDWALADAYLGVAIVSHRSDGNCHRRTAASQKTDNSVLGVLALFSLERDLVGTAKNRCPNSP
jgi:hypothetical protein